MKNILFFFSSTKIGGAETNILKISRELQKRGYNIFWAYLEHNGPMLQLVDFPVITLETGLYYRNYFKFRKRYIPFLKVNKIDCVLNFGLRVELISRVLSKRFGVKKIISNIRSTNDWRNFYHVLLDKFTQKHTDAWVSNSIAGKSAFHKRESIPLDKIRVIYNFIENDQPVSALKNKTLYQGVLNIGILANITRNKGYMDLIELSNRLTNANISHIIKYGGIDYLNGKFQESIIKNGLEKHFCYIGYVSDKSGFFNSIDVFILPTYLEGMPTVLLEAMDHGVPVISTNVGGIPEIIENDVNGYISEPGDMLAFSENIFKLLDPVNLERILYNAENSLEKFKKDNIMDQWEEILNKN